MGRFLAVSLRGQALRLPALFLCPCLVFHCGNTTVGPASSRSTPFASPTPCSLPPQVSALELRDTYPHVTDHVVLSCNGPTPFLLDRRFLRLPRRPLRVHRVTPHGGERIFIYQYFLSFPLHGPTPAGNRRRSEPRVDDFNYAAWYRARVSVAFPRPLRDTRT